MEREREGKQEKREREKKGMGMELRGDWRGEWGRGLEGLEVEREWNEKMLTKVASAVDMWYDKIHNKLKL